MNIEYTPEFITELKPDEYFVFGSNTEGRHGAGSAKAALDKFGAIYGQARGFQGQSYAIETIDLRKGLRSVSLDEINYQVHILYLYANALPMLKFYMTKIGTQRAGYSIEEIRDNCFRPLIEFKPDNVVLPKEFY